jgi:hypothetical protein
LWNVESDGSFVHNINKSNVSGYIYERYGTLIDIYGSYPEKDVLTDSVADSASNYYIQVGSVAENESIRIEYTAKRGSLIEVGTIFLSNASGVDIGRDSYLDDVGLLIIKNISSDAIRLDITDTLTDGNATTLKMNITRVLTS